MTSPHPSSIGIGGNLAVHVLVVALLVVALNASTPYGYYSVMRWIVCASCIFLAIQSHKSNNSSWTWTFGVIAGIYNPVIPVQASRELWSIVNVATIFSVSISAILLIRLTYRQSSIRGGKNKLDLIRETINQNFSLPDSLLPYGFGEQVVGNLSDKEWKEGYVIKQSFSCFLYIPFIPMEFYFVREEATGDVYIGRVPFRTIFRCFSLIELIWFYTKAVLTHKSVN